MGGRDRHLLIDDTRTDDEGHRPSLLTNALSFGNLGGDTASVARLLTVQPGGGDHPQYGLPYADRLTFDPRVAAACGLRFTPTSSIAADEGGPAPEVEVDWLDDQQGVFCAAYPAVAEFGPAAVAVRLGSSITSRD